MSWVMEDVLRATGGELVRRGPESFERAWTDSRTVVVGDLFVALVGDQHDGHAFVDAACDRGARGVMVSRGKPGRPASACIRVRDTLDAYGDLANFRRRRLSARVVAVTGSNGKTTTKEMMASIFEAAGEVVGKSAGNENNLVGLPKTILSLSGDETVDVLEMGMNRRGEIDRLTRIAEPDVGVITNVAPAHLEGLGTIEEIAAAKGELALALRADACLVIDEDDPWLVRIAEGRSGPTLRVGRAANDVRIVSSRSRGGGRQEMVLRILGRDTTVSLPCIGKHNVRNAALAAAAASALGVEPEVIAKGLQSFRLPAMRLEVTRTPSGAVVWNDAYNANPASMRAALEALADEPAERRMAALGEMLELGAESDAFHTELGRQAAAARLDRLVAVGPRGAQVAAGAREGGLADDAVQVAAGPEDAAPLLADLRRGDVVLVKGSRGMQMERLVRALMEVTS